MVLVFLFLAFIIMQFIQPVRNQSGRVSEKDITKVYKIPENVSAVLKTSCYDCHSHNTNYPWYAKIQPVGWWLSSHIKKGKSELNFNEFGDYSKRRQNSKLKSIVSSIEDGTMPLPSYTLIHADAKLSKQDILIIKQAIKEITMHH